MLGNVCRKRIGRGVFLVWAVFLFNKRLEISLDVMNDDVFVELPK